MSYQQHLEALPPHQENVRNVFEKARVEITSEIAASSAAALASANAYTDADNQTGKVIDPEGVVFPPTEMTETG